MKFLSLVIILLIVFAVAEAHSERSCGKALVKRVEKLCPDGCTLESEENFGVSVCAEGLSDKELSQQCCPNVH